MMNVVGLDSDDYQHTQNTTEQEIKTIILVPNDYDKTSKKFIVSKEYSRISKLISVAIDNDKECKEIKLDVSTQIMKIICDYIDLRKGDLNITVKRPVVEPYTSLVASGATEQDNTFINKFSGIENRCILENIMNASLYLDMDTLLQLSASQYALGLSKCNTPKEAEEWFPDNKHTSEEKSLE